MTTPNFLLDLARIAVDHGDFRKASEHYSAVLALDRTCTEALRFLSSSLLLRGEAQRAIDLLEAAIDESLESEELWEVLGLCYQSQNALDKAEGAFQRVIKIAPRNYVVHLYLGAVLEQRKRPYEALGYYYYAINQAQQRGIWTSAQTTPGPLLSRVAHAMQFIQTFRSRALNRIMAPWLTRYGREGLDRVAKFVATYLEEMPTLYEEPQQRPKGIYFPGLPAQPYFDRRSIAWVDELESSYIAIREELLNLRRSGETFESFLKLSTDARLEDYLTSQSERPAWDAFFFYRHGKRFSGAAKKCPETTVVLERLPLLRIQGSAPEVLFSVLAPGTKIQPHYGTTNTRAVVHLPLIIPDRCALKVGGELHVWQAGRCVIFDDTFEHEAWNYSDSDRIVLILDSWNPQLTALEREVLQELLFAATETERSLKSLFQ